MNVVVLTGTSGSGKSTNAIKIGNVVGADYIIDDGVLIKIKDMSIVKGDIFKAGKYIDLLYKASFLDKDHAKSMKNKLETISIKKLLLLAPSKRTGEQILQNIGIDYNIEKEIKIEEILTLEEIELAMKTRKENGTHAFPLDYSLLRNALKTFTNVGDLKVSIISKNGMIEIKNEELTKGFRK